MITDRIGRHEVLLPINHKITIFERRIAKLRKKGKIRIKIPPKEMKNLLPVIRRQKHKSKRVHARTHARTHVITTLNVIG